MKYHFYHWKNGTFQALVPVWGIDEQLGMLHPTATGGAKVSLPLLLPGQEILFYYNTTELLPTGSCHTA